MFKKQIAEIKLLSYIFLAVITSITCLLFTELMTDSVAVSETVDMDEIVRIKADHHLITSILIMLFAFNV